METINYFHAGEQITIQNGKAYKNGKEVELAYAYGYLHSALKFMCNYYKIKV